MPDIPKLLTPLTIRGVTLPNRMVVAPMCQYSSADGFAGDWHLVHLGKFALGGFGVVMTEATAVEERGRITHGDLGVWSDNHIFGLRRVTDFIRREGALAGIQIAHAGRKASTQRPWHGHGPLDAADRARGEPAWPIVSATDEPFNARSIAPAALTKAEIDMLVARFADAAARADAANFDILEIHCAHGYLLASFLSPVVNTRNDHYGGSRDARMRFPLEVASAVRSRWPDGKPLFVRISSVDGAPEGWSIEDSVALVNELRQRGVDVIDCSSGGIRESGTLANTRLGLGYQVGYAREIRQRCDVTTMAVGLILDGHQAEAILQNEDADLIAIGREALYDPFWAHHAARTLARVPKFSCWAEQSGWWLERRAATLSKLDIPDR